MSLRHPRITKRDNLRVLEMLAQGIGIAQGKRDGKPHRVLVIRSIRREEFYGWFQWFSLVVDDTREAGGKLGVGSQETLFDCTVLAEADGGAEFDRGARNANAKAK